MPRRRNSEQSPDIAQVGVGIAAFIAVAAVVFPHLLIAIGCIVVATLIFLIALKIYRIRSGRSIDSIHLHDESCLDAPSAPSNCNRVSFTDEIENLNKIDWYQFEKIVAILYQRLAFAVEVRGGANPDGGLDLIITNAKGERIGVQCKQWSKWKVGVKIVRELLGALYIARIERGALITLSGYTAEAQALATAHNIQLIDKAGLLQLMQETNLTRDREYLAVVNDLRKICPKCDHEMVLRKAVRGFNIGKKFWGCSTYPVCRFKMPISR